MRSRTVQTPLIQEKKHETLSTHTWLPHANTGTQCYFSTKCWTSPSMATGCVDCSLFTANDKVIDISGWESHSCNRHWFGLIVHQLHALLPKQVFVIILQSSFCLAGFLFVFFLINVTHGSRRGRRNHLTQPQGFGFCIGHCEKMQCHKLGCAAPAIPTAVCHTFESGWKALVFATSS